MSELSERDAVSYAESLLKPQYALRLGTGTLDYFIRALDDSATISNLRDVKDLKGIGLDDQISKIEQSEAHRLLLKLKLLRSTVSPNDKLAILTAPLTQDEYNIMREKGQEGRGHSTNEPADAKMNLKILDNAFTRGKRKAGVPGPIRRLVKRIVPTRFQK